MPRVREPQYYAKEFEAVIEEVLDTQAPVVLSFDTVKEALSCRGTWYAYMSALKRGAERAEKKPKVDWTGQDADNVRLHLASAGVVCRIEDTNLVLESRSNSKWARAIARGIERARASGGAPVGIAPKEDPEIAASIERFKKIARMAGPVSEAALRYGARGGSFAVAGDQERTEETKGDGSNEQGD